MGRCVTWRVAGASVAGTSHLEAGRLCEDSCWAQVEIAAGHAPVLSIVVSDGAGSASHGGTGASLAVEAAAKYVADSLLSSSADLGALVSDCVGAVRRAIRERATRDHLALRDFACTLLLVVSTQESAAVCQIGDGAAVVDMGTGLEVAVVPMSGEYANMTHFVTDDDAEAVAVTKVYSGAVNRVAVFSDGLQRLALDMAANKPHAPFFDPFFKVLASSTEGQQDALVNALIEFLESPGVNARTDDDKTLAVATLVPQA